MVDTDPRRYPDPLHVPGDEPTRQRLQKAYEAGVADGHRIHVLALVLMIGLGFVIGFVIAGSVMATSGRGIRLEDANAPVSDGPGVGGRSDPPRATSPDAAVSTVRQGNQRCWDGDGRVVASRSGARVARPPVAQVAGPVSVAVPLACPTIEGAADRAVLAAPLPSPTSVIDGDDGGGIWGTPPDTATDLRQGRTGIIAQAKGHGPNYLAIPIGPGHLVEVCGPAACWTTVSTDGGPNRAMLKAGRIADVAVGHWVVICGVPAVLGLCDGSWHVVSAGTTPPPTDVTP